MELGGGVIPRPPFSFLVRLTMTIKILKPEVLTSAGFAHKGDLVELPTVEARRLIDVSFAEAAPQVAKRSAGWQKLNRQMRPGSVVTR